MMEKSLYQHRDHCRLCRSKNMELVFALAPTPPANAFVKKKDLDQNEPKIPLDLYFCKECSHLQLLDVVDPLVLFKDYVYVSGTSPVFVKHFQDYEALVSSRFGLGSQSFVVDIGSNDGTLLKIFKQRGCKVLGIDPAEAIARKASSEGIETLADLFTSSLAERLASQYGKASAIVANNVFAHIDHLEDVVLGVRNLLTPNGVFVFEVSYLVDVLEKRLFDTIYHEHLCYHSVMPLKLFFERNGMELFDVERVNSHGGSLRGFAKLRGGSHAISSRVQDSISLEKTLGLDQAATFKKFARDIEGLKQELSSLLKSLKSQGKKIAGFGAPAKATTLMHHFELGSEYIDFIVDDSPWKQNLFSPGYHIPVLPASAIQERKPDYLLLLAWNFADSIMNKHSEFKNKGGHFILPVPTVKVI